MNEIIELTHPSQLQRNESHIWGVKTRSDGPGSQSTLYLLQYFRDFHSGHRQYGLGFKTFDGIIQSGTLQVVNFAIGFTINPVTIAVMYEKKPGDLQFNRSYQIICDIDVFHYARVFRIGILDNINILKQTPEEVSIEHFGTSDISKLISYIPNRSAFSKRMSLEYANRMGLVPPHELERARVPLLGTHQLYQPTFQRNEQRSSFFVRQYPYWHSVSDIFRDNVRDRDREIQDRMRSMVTVPRSERRKLLTNGALSAMLVQRLSQPPPHGPRTNTIKHFADMHRRVHKIQLPKSRESDGGSKKANKANTRKKRH